MGFISPTFGLLTVFGRSIKTRGEIMMENKTLYTIIGAILVILILLPFAGKIFGNAVPASTSTANAAAQSPTTPANSTNVTTIATDTVSALTRGEITTVTAKFDSTMKAALSPTVLQQTWGQVIAQFGSFKKQAGTRNQTVQGLDVTWVTCEFERGKADVQIAVNSSGQISGLYILPAAN